MARVLIVFTGGTISMRAEPEAGGVVPALSGEEILAYDPTLRRVADLEVVDFGRFPGPHMNPDRMFRLSQLLRHQLQRPEIDAAVVTHGTDTLEETAYITDLRHDSGKPVAFVGAMRNSSELGFDGPANLRAGVRTVIDQGARERGVFVVLNQLVHAASEATKTDTQQMETFQSPVFGPLGYVDADRVVWARALERRALIVGERIETRVELLRMYAGFGSFMFDALRDAGVKGIVVEGTGRGNVPPEALAGLQRVLDAGIPVVLSTRCHHGRVLDTYAYEGSGRDLRKRGVWFGGRLPGHKARIKLMAALGAADGLAEAKLLMEDDV
ncbi:MAG TPA: asparaginase [Bryobacteraceae bacterium]|nr:asparaginase [Bryobacteraceae bacterium]